MKNTIILLFAVQLSVFANSKDQSVVVAVGEAEVEKDSIVVSNRTQASAANKELTSLASEVGSIIQSDLNFYKKRLHVKDFQVKETITKSFLDKNGISYGINYSVKKNGEDFLIRGSVLGKSINVDLASSTFSPKSLRAAVHDFTDKIYYALTGQRSIFKSRIIFVSDKHGTRSKPVKELYVMDFDGGNARRLTRHGGTVISPSLSFDGSQVLYSLIRNSNSKKRNINLYILDVKSGKSRLLSSRRGINSGAYFMPDGENIILTMTHHGNAELYAMNLKTKAERRITKHYAPDVDPSVNVSGTLMAFLSGRSGAGKPMIYIADPRGLEKDIKRISFVGKFNATPRFSPDGSQIAFSSWLDNKFDIFRVDANGSNLHRLTKDFGSNESPTYSNDGQFIAFSSQRVLSMKKAVQNIYIMDRDGEIIGQVTEKLGNCSSPRWSK